MYIAFDSFFYSSSAYRLLLKWVSTPNACVKKTTHGVMDHERARPTECALWIRKKRVPMCPGLNGSALIKDVRMYQKFLKTKFTKLIQRHLPCLELCVSYAFDSCAEEHKAMCSDVLPIYTVHSTLMEKIESLPDPSKEEQKSRLSDFYNTHFDYLAHLLRTKHQIDYYKFVLKNLKRG